MDINLPDVLAEMQAVFAEYELALVQNDVDVLDRLFWTGPFVLRFGIGENLYGHPAIKAFRAARSPAGLARRLERTVIVTFGRDFATANTEFYRDSTAKIGRQSQTWVRMAEGWRIVAAHVSLIDPPKAAG